MLARFFMDRPVLAWVSACVITLTGLLSVWLLPVGQYPDIAPPAVMITARYPGATAQAVENSVTKILEQELKGVERLMYFSASSSASGQAELLLTFSQGTDIDTALVQVQNLANQAVRRLPSPVQLNGLQVRKLQNSFLMIVSVYDQTHRMSDTDIADWMATTLQDPISRIEGVGSLRVFDSPYAMRIWLDPHKLNSYGLIPNDIVEAVRTQNADLSVGELGARPSPPGQHLNVTVSALSRLQTPEQFRDIVIKTLPNGALLRLGQVARVELGSETYQSSSRLNGHPASAFAIMLTPGANAMRTADAIKARVAQLAPQFPPGLQVVYPEDSTRFVKLSIKEVVKTLLEAMALVVLVMYVFLGNWRATLIPAITVPVVLLGTFAVLALGGYSINTLTLFGMVLAIGLLVDDTIVVVENVQRIMQEKGLDAPAATRRSMGEITSALVGISLVLGAIFLPMAFFPGSVGVIYRQFSVTLVVSMALSMLMAISLTPALCARLLRPVARRHPEGGPLQGRYQHWLGWVLARPVRFGLVYLLLVGVMLEAYPRLPTAFIPDEDQGTVMVRFSLPQGATADRTLDVAQAVEHYFLTEEKDNTDAVYVVSGFSFEGAGQNAGMAFVSLSDWARRTGAANTAQAIADRAMARLGALRDAEVFAMVPPPVEGLGQSNGFELWLQDGGSLGREGLARAAEQLVHSARQSQQFSMVRAEGTERLPQLRIDIDQAKAAALGLNLNDVHSTLEVAWGGLYVNDFVHQDRIKKVFVQADGPYRASPDNLADWFVRGNNGQMSSFAAFASTRWTTGPGELKRYNGAAALPVAGVPGEGISSGQAMGWVEHALGPVKGVTFEWSGLSYEEKKSSGKAMLLYGVSLFFVFLCLAALYESWTVPCAVLLVVPLGVLGAMLAVGLRGLPNDIYFQVGLLTTMGLAAKNAILIVEFAEAELKAGAAPLAAVLKAAGLRLRPILMTSLAFGAGVVPLALAWGPSSASQNAIGTSVLGGVVSGTLLALVFVPVFYVLLAHRGQAIARAK